RSSCSPPRSHRCRGSERCFNDDALAMPTASRLLRLLGFAVPAALLLAGVQPIMGAATGSIGPLWAAKLAAPAIVAAAALFAAAKLFDRGDICLPSLYTVWVHVSVAFLLAGAAWYRL